MTKVVPTDKARQGSRGWQVLVVLICALILAALAWWGAEIYGEAIDPPAAQEQAAPSN